MEVTVDASTAQARLQKLKEDIARRKKERLQQNTHSAPKDTSKACLDPPSKNITINQKVSETPTSSKCTENDSMNLFPSTPKTCHEKKLRKRSLSIENEMLQGVIKQGSVKKSKIEKEDIKDLSYKKSKIEVNKKNNKDNLKTISTDVKSQSKHDAESLSASTSSEETFTEDNEIEDNMKMQKKLKKKKIANNDIDDINHLSDKHMAGKKENSSISDNRDLGVIKKKKNRRSEGPEEENGKKEEKKSKSNGDKYNIDVCTKNQNEYTQEEKNIQKKKKKTSLPDNNDDDVSTEVKILSEKNQLKGQKKKKKQNSSIHEESENDDTPKSKLTGDYLFAFFFFFLKMFFSFPFFLSLPCAK